MTDIILQNAIPISMEICNPLPITKMSASVSFDEKFCLYFDTESPVFT